MLERNGKVVARARALAPAVGAKIWVEVAFEPSDYDPWSQAYDRLLRLLDLE